MFEKIGALLGVMMKGQEVMNPAVWKARQIKANVLAGFLLAALALAKSYGWDIPVDEQSATEIALGIIAVVNIVMTMASSKKAGVGGQAPADPDKPAP